ncbi:MAG TPA: serine/threonine protein phosphatase [Deltaproteobacteria bacterium]|nr:serine/threonine protein phosphatase [Deltaproteobacteria bacterium]
MNKIFAIGDIHGCLDKLEELIGKIPAEPQKDQLVFLGDYIDRGKYSRDAVDFVISLKNIFRNIVYLMGNHERMFLNYLDGIEEELYLANGGRYTLQDYGIAGTDSPVERKKKIPGEHIRFYNSLLPYYESEKYLFVHAGLIPGLEPAKQKIDDLVWVRRDFIDSSYDFGKIVVFGHTRFGRPLIEKNKIGIDTGAVYGGQLTCVELPAVNIYQV